MAANLVAPPIMVSDVRIEIVGDDDTVKVSGEGSPPPVDGFGEAGLAEPVLRNVAMCGLETPTLVQRYSMPVVLAGRDLMVYAPKGSGEIAALCIPVVSELVKAAAKAGIARGEGASSRSRYGLAATPRALLLAPTSEIATQINEEANKLSYQTGLRVVLIRKGTESYSEVIAACILLSFLHSLLFLQCSDTVLLLLEHEIHELMNGVDILIATPRVLIILAQRFHVSLEAIKYLVLYEVGLILDMGFELALRKIVYCMTMPRKSARQTLCFSSTFPPPPPEIQKLALDFLSNYIIITVGEMGSITGRVMHAIELANCYEVKRGFLLHILQNQSRYAASMLHHPQTLVFVETKQEAESLNDWLCNKGFRATVMFGHSSEHERESALKSLETGLTPILIVVDATSRCMDVPNVAHVISYDLPKTIEEYINRIAIAGRTGKVGSATAFFSESNHSLAKGLLELMTKAKQEVPDWLVTYAEYPCRSKKLELQDEYEQSRYDLAGSLASRKVDSVSDLLQIYVELNCKNGKRDIYEDAVKWMSEECCLALEQQQQYKLHEYKFIELLQHCCIPEQFGKVYYHYNFTAEVKNKESGIWTRGIYFAERKTERGVESLFCSLLKPLDNGHCHGCQNEGVEIRHPTEGDYQRGTPDCGAWCDDFIDYYESSDEDMCSCERDRLDH